MAGEKPNQKWIRRCWIEQQRGGEDSNQCWIEWGQRKELKLDYSRQGAGGYDGRGVAVGGGAACRQDCERVKGKLLPVVVAAGRMQCRRKAARSSSGSWTARRGSSMMKWMRQAVPAVLGAADVLQEERTAFRAQDCALMCFVSLFVVSFQARERIGRTDGAAFPSLTI